MISHLHRVGCCAVMAAALSGCGLFSESDNYPPSVPVPVPPAPQASQRITDTRFLGQLETAPINANVPYWGADGSQGEVRLILGPSYESARGVVCRTGHAALGPNVGGPVGVPAFCHGNQGWYQIRDVVVGLGRDAAAPG